MRIGIDATCWANERGYGRYTRELVSAMVPLASAHELVCVLDERAAARFDLDSPNVRRLVVAQSASPTLAASSGSRRGIADMLRLTRAVWKERFDVFYSPSVYGYFPLPPGLPAVVTVHDAIAERFPHLTLPAARDRWFWRLKVSLALAQARLVLTVSDYASREVAACLQVPASRLRVTLEGVAAAYAPVHDASQVASAAAAAGLPAGARWLMYVGGFGPHKYVDAIVRAHARAVKTLGEPVRLVLSGPAEDVFHADTAAIRRAIDDSGTRDLVIWAGFVADEALRYLHAGALALVLASASEGFGLPAVEAARCGAPVIATTESPLPQILEGGGLFVPPGDVDAIASAIVTLASDEPARRAMGARALERASALSWTKSAAVALAALEEAAAPRRKAA